MIPLEVFHQGASSELKMLLNEGQRAAVDAPADAFLFIVAGPGTGKTAVVALRVLRHVFVDSFSPETIVATTFTRRAARELRSRILAWGDVLRNWLLRRGLPVSTARWIQRLDLNAIITGTLDRIAELVLTDYRPPGSGPPIVLEEFVSQALMLRQGLLRHGRYGNAELSGYLAMLNGTPYGLDLSRRAEILLQIRQRLLHDGVDVSAYRSASRPCAVYRAHRHPGVEHVLSAINDYSLSLRLRGAVDFVQLERDFADGLANQTLNEFREAIKVVLVDEYQDTNLLQESIYFQLARNALASGGGLTVVGDDDQSLYRFRGATVDLFRGFPQRLAQYLGVAPQLIFLHENYRSTHAIVTLCNEFVGLDRPYQDARVSGKPPIVPRRNAAHNPKVLAMFRPDLPRLARDLAEFIYEVFQGKGYPVPEVGQMQGDPSGSVGDCALLCHSPQENRGGKRRLPGLLRDELAKHGISVFNPRGQDLADVSEVRQLLGLMLECIDPGSSVQNSTHVPPEVAVALMSWRFDAQQLVNACPSPNQPVSLHDFVRSWQQRHPQGGGSWPSEASLVDLAYKLITWIPKMRDDIEGLVYLEVVLRTIVQASQFGRYGPNVVFYSTDAETRSIQDALWNVFAPLAAGAVKIDEDLLETLPRDRLNVLSIHQAKGLEFPMVIVDVGSDFQRNHPSQAFQRFPEGGGLTGMLEDELRQFSPLGLPVRPQRDRAFDDLIRRYFVAFSRAQDVLVLVGLDAVKDGRVRNVGTGWDRAGTWHWDGLRDLVHI